MQGVLRPASCCAHLYHTAAAARPPPSHPCSCYALPSRARRRAGARRACWARCQQPHWQRRFSQRPRQRVQRAPTRAALAQDSPYGFHAGCPPAALLPSQPVPGLVGAGALVPSGRVHSTGNGAGVMVRPSAHHPCPHPARLLAQAPRAPPCAYSPATCHFVLALFSPAPRCSPSASLALPSPSPVP